MGFLNMFRTLFPSSLTMPKRLQELQFIEKFYGGSIYREYQRLLNKSPMCKLSNFYLFFLQFVADSKFFDQISQCQKHRECYNFSDLRAVNPLFSNFEFSKIRSGRPNCQTGIFFLLPLSKASNQHSQCQNCANFSQFLRFAGKSWIKQQY